jgi:tetratricopeptide (TPR) repeat protein
MQQRLDDLKAALRDDPSDRAALDELRAIHVESGAWDELYAFCGDLADGLRDAAAAEALWLTLLQAMSAHIVATDDPLLAAELHARVGDLLCERLGDPAGGVVHYRLGFERWPDPRYAARTAEVLARLPELAEHVAALTERKGTPPAAAAAAAAADEAAPALAAPAASAPAPSPEPEPDDSDRPTAVGIPAFVEEDVAEDGAADGAADGAPAGAADVAPAGAPAAPAAAPSAAAAPPTDAAAPGQDAEARALADRLRGEKRWNDLAAHLETWLERAAAPAVRQRVARELGLLWQEQLKNPPRALAFLEQSFALDAADVTVRDLLVEQYTARERWDDLQQLYETARQATTDRDEERRLLLERARVQWHRLGDMEGAERHYRRLRAHPPMASEALDFYEAWYAAEEDWRKLYTTLAQRQSEAEGEQRVAIGVRMARVADEQMSNPDKAIEAWKRVLSWAPEHVEALTELPALYERTGKWHALLEFLNARVSRIEGGDDAARRERTALLRRIVGIYADDEKLGVPEMVIHTYNRILQVDPNDGAAQEALCQRYEEAGRWSELVTVLKQMAEAADDAPTRAALLKRQALLWRDRLKNPSRAVEPLEAALAVDAGDREALEWLRDIHRQKHSLEELYDVNRRSLAVASDAEREELLRELALLAAEKLHRYEDGVADWEALLELKPGDDQAIQALQKLYARNGAWDRYVTLLERQLGTVAGEARLELLGRLGQIAFDRLRDYPRAKEIFQEVAAIAPNHPLARTYLQKIHILQQSWGELEQLYRESQDWRSYIAVLNDHQEREPDPAIKVQLNLQIARLYEEHLGDQLRALKRYERARQLEPENLDVARLLAERYRQRRDWSRLSDVFETIAEVSDDPAEVRAIQQQLIDLALQMKKPAQAFEWSARGLAFDLQAGRVEAIARLEELAEQAGTWGELAALLDGQRASVESGHARLALLRSLGAICKDRLHDAERAVGVFREAGELQPGEPAVLDALEELYIATSDFDGLESVYRQRIDMADRFEVIRENTLKLGQVYEDILADADQAIACYQRLLDADPGDRVAILGLKRVFEREERFEELLAVIEQELAASDDPEERAGLHCHLGRLHEHHLERVEDAIESYRTALELRPSHEEALAALEALFQEDAPGQRGLVAPILEPIYRAAGRFDDLSAVLQARCDAAETPSEQTELLYELARLAEHELQDPARAYAAWRRLFVLNPALAEAWDQLERLADGVGVLDDVAALYAAAADFLPEGYEALAEDVPRVDDPHDARALLARLAHIHEEQLDDVAAAGGAWRAVLAAEPDDAEALAALERLYEAAGEWEALREVLAREAELAWDVDRKKSLYLRLSALLRDHLREPDEAVRALQRVLDLDEANRAVMGELETLYREGERWDDLVALLKRRLAYAADDGEAADTRIELGVLLRDRLDETDAAIDAFEAALPHPDRRATAREALAALLHDRDRSGHASWAGRVAGILEPFYREAEDWEALIRLLDVRAALAPDDLERAQVLRSIGAVLETRLGADERAMERYGSAFLLTPGDAGLAADLDRVAARLGAWEAYALVLAEAIDGTAAEGRSADVVRKAAQIHHERLEDAAEATRLYELLLDVTMADEAALAALDRLYQAAGETGKRVAVLRQRAELTPDLDEQRALWFTVGELERDREGGRVDDAIEAFTFVVERSPDKQAELAVEAYGQLELLYELTERWDALIQMMLERYEYCEDLEERKTYLYRAAMTYEERQEAPEDAIALYVRALDLDPRDDVARAALRRLYEDTERWSELEGLLTEELSFTDDPGLRAELLLRLGLLYEEQIEDPGRALGSYRDLIALDPHGEAGIEALRRLLADPDQGFGASEVLADAFRRAGRDRDLSDIYALQLERFGDHIDVLETLFARAQLQEDRFGDGDGAFDSYAAAFRQDPRSERAWDALVRLARGRDRWDDLFALVEDVLPDVFDPADRTFLRLRTAALQRDERHAPQRAETIYWEILEDEPEHAASLDALEALYLAAERWDRLAEVLSRRIESAVDVEPRIALQRRLGRLYQEQLGRSDDAAVAFEDVLALEPTDPESFERLEQLYGERADWEAAVDLLERKAALSTDSAETASALRALARIQYRERGERDTAIDAAARLLDLQPDDAAALGILEEIHGEGHARERVGEILEPIFLQQRAWPKLVTLYRGWLEDEALDDHTRLTHLRAILRIQTEELDDPPAAFATLTSMLSLQPDDEALHEQAAGLCARRDNWGELAELYRTLLAGGGATGPLDDPLFVSLSLRLARIDEEQLDSPPAAIQQYGRILEREENHPEAIAALERLLTAAADWTALVKLYEHVAETSLEPDRAVTAHLKAAAVLRDRLGDAERAADELQQVIDLEPDNLEAYAAAEALHRATGGLDALDSLYRSWMNAVAEPETRADVSLRLARLLVERGDLAEAMDRFRDIFVLVPGHAEALAWLEERLDDVPTDEAAERLRREVVEVLEPHYGEGTPAERWVALYMAQLEFTEETERRSEILRRIGDVWLGRAGDRHAAFEFYAQAFALDFGNEALEGDLERLAAEGGYWADLLALYEDGLGPHTDDFVVDRYLLRCARIARGELGDPARAAGYYERVLARDPGNVEALEALEPWYRTHDRARQLAEVLRLRLDTALSDDQRRATMSSLADLLHESLGAYDEAEGVYRDLLLERPDDAHAQAKLQEIVIARGDWEALVDLYHGMLAVAADEKASIDLLSRMAQVYETQLERYDDAIQCYNDLFQYDPDSLYAVTSLERIYRIVADWDGLLQVLRRKRALVGDRAERAAIDYECGTILLEQMAIRTEAIVALERTLEVLPDHEGAIAALEGLLADRDYCLEAARILRPVFEKQGAWARLVPLFGLQAELEDEPALRAGLHEQAATVQIERLGDLEAGFAALGRALVDTPDDRALRDRLMGLAEQFGAWALLAGTLTRVREDAGDAGVRRSLDLWLGRLHEERTGDPDAAIRHYQQVLEVDEYHRDALDALDRLLQARQRWDELAGVLQSQIAADAGERSLTLKYRLAWLREAELADAAGALDLYREVLWEQPDHADATERVETIAREHPDLQETAVAVLEPLYRQQERWRALTALLRLRTESMAPSPERSELLVQSAELFELRLEDVQNAFELYAQALDGCHDVGEIVRELERITESHGMWPRLAVALEEALARAPDQDARLDLQMRLGSVYMNRLKQGTKAEGHLRAVVQADPENVAALRLLEEAYETAGNLDELVRICQARARLPIDLDERKRLYHKVASVSELRHDDAAAIASYEAILELDPADGEAFERLESIHERHEDHAALVDVLDRRAAETRDPAALAALKVRIGALQEVHVFEPDRAVDAYEAALELQPDNLAALDALERLYGQLERWELMRDVLERRARLTRDTDERVELLLRAAALVERELSDPRGAVALYRDAIDVDPTNAPAIRELARLLEAAEEWPALAQTLERLRGLVDDEAEQLELDVRVAGLLESRLSDFDAALARLEAVLEKAPDHVEALLGLGRLYEGLEEWSEAVVIYERLLPKVESTTERVRLLRKLGRVTLEALDDPDRAGGFLAQARAVDDSDPEVLRLLSDIHRRAGDTVALAGVLARAFEVGGEPERRVAQALELAELAKGRADGPEYVRWLEAAYALEPGHRVVLEGLVAHHEGRGDDVRTAELLGRLVDGMVARRETPGLGGLAFRLGGVRERTGDVAGAVEAYRLARQHDAANVANLLALGRLLAAREENGEALKVLQALLLQQNRLTEEQTIDLFLKLTEICLADNDDKRARQYVGRLLRLAPDHPRGAELKARLK